MENSGATLAWHEELLYSTVLVTVCGPEESHTSLELQGTHPGCSDQAHIKQLQYVVNCLSSFQPLSRYLFSENLRNSHGNIDQIYAISKGK